MWQTLYTIWLIIAAPPTAMDAMLFSSRARSGRPWEICPPSSIAGGLSSSVEVSPSATPVHATGNYEQPHQPAFVVLPRRITKFKSCPYASLRRFGAPLCFVTSAMDETYATVFSETHTTILDSISISVQEPPLGPFNCKALKWDYVFRHYGQQHESRYVMQYYNPLNCVSDFVIGEESLAGANCKYIRTHLINNTKHGLLQSCGDSALYVDSCVLILYFPYTLSTFAASTLPIFVM